MRKYWYLKLIVILGFLFSWIYSDKIHEMLGMPMGNLYFLVYLFILGILFVEYLAWFTSDTF